MSKLVEIPEMPFFVSTDPKDISGNVFFLTLNIHDKCKIDTGETKRFKNGKEIKIYKNWDTYTDSDIFYKSVVIMQELLDDSDHLYAVCEKSSRTLKTHAHALLYTNQAWHDMQLLQEAIHKEYVPVKLQYRTPLKACLDIRYLSTLKDLHKTWAYMHKDREKPWFQIDYTQPAPEYKRAQVPENSTPAIERCLKCDVTLPNEEDRYERFTWTGQENLHYYYCHSCKK